ncbi:ABC transporter substrate-binding protein [Viscerimonas tarda]
MKIKILLLALVFLSLYSCRNGGEKRADATALERCDIKYAKGFDIKKQAGYVEVTVYNPWDSTSILQKYILVEKDKDLPPELPEGRLIRTPLENIAVFSTVHCAVLQELGILNIISGVCEPQYINVDYIAKGVADGSIADLGQASSPNIEKIIMIDPEVIMVSPIQGMAYGAIDKTGVPLIETPDYMESTPLGRTEWIKFYSAFLGKEQQADSLFADIEHRYNEIKTQVEQTTGRPTVFNDVKYGNMWYVPGGKSYMANLLKDAGACYLWADDEATGSVMYSYEAILDKAEDTQFWLIKYNNRGPDMTYKSLEKEFKPYSYFDAFRNRNVYGCNTGKVPYYEDLPIHPEYVLQDMVAVFHPALFPGYEPRYFKKLEE